MEKQFDGRQLANWRKIRIQLSAHPQLFTLGEAQKIIDHSMPYFGDSICPEENRHTANLKLVLMTHDGFHYWIRVNDIDDNKIGSIRINRELFTNLETIERQHVGDPVSNWWKINIEYWMSVNDLSDNEIGWIQLDNNRSRSVN